MYGHKMLAHVTPKQPRQRANSHGAKIVKLRFKQHNIKHPFSSMTVTQFTTDPHMLVRFTYFDDKVCILTLHFID